MDEKVRKPMSLPTLEQVEKERKRLKRGRQYKKALSGTIAVLVVVAAVAVLVATLLLPILQVAGTSMEPTLQDGDIILLFKARDFETGELIGMRHDGKVLLKRVIGCPGDYVSIDEEGNVSVNGELLDEPYVSEKSLGECDITFPYQVPENAYFVLGDHRSVSIDSRSTVIGCIREEQIIGRVVLRIWPFSKISWI